MLGACSNEVTYEPKDISIRENTKSKALDEEPSINGIYEVDHDTGLYENPEDKNPFEQIDKGSSVRVLEEAEGAFVRIDYFGNMGYIKVNTLKEIQ